MFLLDTNLLVYSANIACDFNQRASEIMDKVISGDVKACICLQNLNEFFSTITNIKRVETPLSSVEAILEIKKYIELESLLKISFTQRSLIFLCELVERYKVTGQDIYDLKIVATMIEHEIKTIITANEKDFLRYSEVEVINPFKEDFDIDRSLSVFSLR